MVCGELGWLGRGVGVTGRTPPNRRASPSIESVGYYAVSLPATVVLEYLKKLCHRLVIYERVP